MSLHKIVLVRHGESEWTKKNLFCGWYNAPLSEKGVSDAIAVGQKLKEAGLKFDVAFTSQLMRAKNTLELILKEIGQPDLPVKCSWKLNERHYGALTGLNKEEAVVKFGYEQVQTWRRSFDVFPPPMDETHSYYQEIENFIVNMNGSDTVYIPKVETLKTTMERVIPFFLENIVPEIVFNKRVLIICHGTCLRGIVKYLDQISDHDIMKINIPTAIPFFYELDLNMKPIRSMVFLSDEETVRKGMLKTASINYKNT